MDYKFDMKKVPGYDGRVLEMRDECEILVHQPWTTIYACWLLVFPTQEDAKQAIQLFLDKKADAVQQAWIGRKATQGQRPVPRTQVVEQPSDSA